MPDRDTVMRRDMTTHENSRHEPRQDIQVLRMSQDQGIRNSSGDEIANLNIFTTTSYLQRPAPTPVEPIS